VERPDLLMEELGVDRLIRRTAAKGVLVDKNHVAVAWGSKSRDDCGGGRGRGRGGG
jgi:hypothetical protein